MPLPCLTIAPPTPPIIPAKVTVAVEVPAVKVLEPSATWLLATPLKSPTVVPLVVELIEKIEVQLLTETAPVESKDPEPDKLNVPALIVVPPV